MCSINANKIKNNKNINEAKIHSTHTLTKEIVTLQLNQVWGVYVCVNVSYDHETAPSHPAYRSNSQITLSSREILVSR